MRVKSGTVYAAALEANTTNRTQTINRQKEDNHAKL